MAMKRRESQNMLFLQHDSQTLYSNFQNWRFPTHWVPLTSEESRPINFTDEAHAEVSEFFQDAIDSQFTESNQFVRMRTAREETYSWLLEQYSEEEAYGLMKWVFGWF